MRQFTICNLNFANTIHPSIIKILIQTIYNSLELGARSLKLEGEKEPEVRSPESEVSNRRSISDEKVVHP